MINKADLRIGNSVMLIDRSNAVHLPIEKPFAIVELKTFTVELAPLGIPLHKVENFIEASYADLEPIPITEEALVKQLKFTKINEKLFCKGRLIVAIQDGKAFFTDDITVINLDGIHHLQNVFYFKHQTELIYEITTTNTGKQKD